MKTKPRRRWFQFGIKTLLLLTFGAACFSSGWVAHRQFAYDSEAEERLRLLSESAKSMKETELLLESIRTEQKLFNSQFTESFRKARAPFTRD